MVSEQSHPGASTAASDALDYRRPQFDLEARLLAIEQKNAAIELAVDKLYLGDTKLFKAVLAFFGLAGTILTIFLAASGIFSYSAFSVSTSRIDEAIKDDTEKIEERVAASRDNEERLTKSAREAIDKLTGGEIVNSSIVNAVSYKEGIVRVSPGLEKGSVTNKLGTFALELSFSFKIGVLGTGVGRLLGYFIKFEGKLPEKIATGYFGGNETFIQSLKDGEFQAIESKIVEGSPLTVTYQITTRYRTCKEAAEQLLSIRKDRDLGRVFVRPVFEKIRSKPEAFGFGMEIGNLTSIYDCQYLTGD